MESFEPAPPEGVFAREVLSASFSSGASHLVGSFHGREEIAESKQPVEMSGATDARGLRSCWPRHRVCRTYGARCTNDFFPALTGWANFCRAYGSEREVKRAGETPVLRRAAAE